LTLSTGFSRASRTHLSPRPSYNVDLVTSSFLVFCATADFHCCLILTIDAYFQRFVYQRYHANKSDSIVSNMLRYCLKQNWWARPSYFSLQLLLVVQLLFLWSYKSENVCSDLAHLDLFCPLGDPVPSEMSIDVLKRVMARVPIPTVNLFSQPFPQTARR
jgi:hypothetical protein